MKKCYLLGGLLFAVCTAYANTGPIIEQSTLDKIQTQLTRSEYFINRENNTGVYQSTNRQHSLLATYTSREMSITPRNTLQPWSFGLTVKGVAADGRPLYQPAALTSVKMNDGTVQFNHDNHYTVEYVNNDEGIRQNFIIQQPAVQVHTLSVQLQTAEGWQTFKRSETSLTFRNQEHLLYYNDLKVWDARGTILPAHFSVRDNQVQIEVDVKKAVYPVTIDPIVLNGTPQNANTFLQSNQENALMGFRVATAGDINGDGRDEVMLLAPSYHLTSGGYGAVFIYYGSNRGINPNVKTTLAHSVNGGQYFAGMAGGGDLNGDNFDDIAINVPADSQHQGGLAIYYGTSTGLDTTAQILYGDPSYGSLAGYLAIAKDLNGDEIDDLVVGSTTSSHGQIYEGIVTIIYGNAWGIENSAWTIIEGNQAGFQLGTRVMGANDINNDGYNDIVVAAANKVLTYYGGPAGVEITPATTMTLSIPDERFSISAGGDINGDGYSDLIVGNPNYSNGQSLEGAVFVYHGSSTGLDSVPAQVLEGNKDSTQFAVEISFAGDVNADGFSDVVVGAISESNNINQRNEGFAYVFYGRSNGINPVPASTIQSNQANACLGFSVAGAGDVNGDGYSDVLVGAFIYANGQPFEGAGFVYHGGAGLAGLLAAAPPETSAKIETPASAAVKVYPNPAVNNLSVQLQGLDSHSPTYIQIVNIQGTTVQITQAGSIEGYQQSIDISKLTPGIYFLVVRNGSKIFREKIIKQ
ncbi:FG-GAP-like repeat-containing protein [Chitinophaga pinensis]|uniref:FG-GAP repeat protein n=1 Tax=Chitinophaga pinensis (strain ATCC 43595 / DSM 2588 / LMG 13176 / NBRC 15968 / NCIMB 11800 / UQM 2034) TaxID=485918 RepID=A0A979G6R8_CHIPD|nr:FG-GAP-like repeat-containing protein [Chitinophaga pinensis]ACU61652.1 FG-GAP repeat protein [Chitinophaga pinensis DSM 2588]